MSISIEDTRFDTVSRVNPHSNRNPLRTGKRFRVEAEPRYRTAVTQSGTRPRELRLLSNRYRATLNYFKLARCVERASAEKTGITTAPFGTSAEFSSPRRGLAMWSRDCYVRIGANLGFNEGFGRGYTLGTSRRFSREENYQTGKESGYFYWMFIFDMNDLERIFWEDEFKNLLQHSTARVFDILVFQRGNSITIFVTRWSNFYEVRYRYT